MKWTSKRVIKHREEILLWKEHGEEAARVVERFIVYQTLGTVTKFLCKSKVKQELRKVIRVYGGFPFKYIEWVDVEWVENEPFIPNKKTIEAMKEAEKPEELETFDSVDDFMADSFSKKNEILYILELIQSRLEHNRTTGHGLIFSVMRNNQFILGHLDRFEKKELVSFNEEMMSLRNVLSDEVQPIITEYIKQVDEKLSLWSDSTPLFVGGGSYARY